MPKQRSNDAELIFDQLVQKHGATDIGDIAVCRSIATLLSAEVITPQ